MKKHLLNILLTFCSIISISAQGFGNHDADTRPITWRANARMVSETEGVVTFTATMADGWHLYGMQMPKDGPKPTKFTFETNGDIVLNGKLTVDKAPVVKEDPLYKSAVQYWEGTVVFKQSFKLVDKSAKDMRIKCHVDFMGCNDATCLPPEQKAFNLRILPKR